MPDAESILKPLQLPDSVKADAWDAYTHSANTDELTAKLKQLPLDDSVRADLWDAKRAETPTFHAEGTATTPRGFLQKVGDIASGAYAGVEYLGKGVISGMAKSEVGAYHLLRMIPGADHILPDLDEVKLGGTVSLADNRRTPDGAMGHIGNFLEQAAELAIPMGEVAKAFKSLEEIRAARAAATGVKAARFLPAVAKVGAEAATAAATTGVQTGGDVPAMAESAATVGALGAAGAAVPAATRAAAVPLLQKLIDNAPKPLSKGAQELADKLGVPLTRGMIGGSKTVQAAEKLLGHTVAPDLYEPLIEKAQQGVNAGAKEVSGGFATDKFTAGHNTIRTMLGSASDFEDQAKTEYANLAKFEADPANTRTVQVGTKPNPDNAPRWDSSFDPNKPETVPDMKAIGLPVDMRSAKAVLAPEVDNIQRFMTPAQKRADPGLAAIQNILSRPDHLSASVAEGDLSYLKEILRSDATPQAKRLAGKAIDAMEPEVQSAVAMAGKQATASLNDARGAWQARSEILDQVRNLSGDATGSKGQVMFANKLLQPADASYPALAKVLDVAPDAAKDLGMAYLTERVFKGVAENGEDFVRPKEAQNLWNHIGPRTKAALYTPEQIQGVSDFLELAKRVAENPNPSGTGTLNALLKLGVMVTHPGAGAAGFALGRNVAKVLYSPEGAANLRAVLTGGESPRAAKAMLAIKAAVTADETPQASQTQ